MNIFDGILLAIVVQEMFLNDTVFRLALCLGRSSAHITYFESYPMKWVALASGNISNPAKFQVAFC